MLDIDISVAALATILPSDEGLETVLSSFNTNKSPAVKFSEARNTAEPAPISGRFSAK